MTNITTEQVRALKEVTGKAFLVEMCDSGREELSRWHAGKLTHAHKDQSSQTF
jgi:hypothetical protein